MPPSPFQRMMGRGPSDVGYAVRSYADERGAHRCDVVCVDNSLATYMGCYVLNSQGSKIGAPREVWTGTIDPVVHPLVVILHRYAGMTPIVLGRLDNASITFTSDPKGETYDPEVDDTPETTTPDDVALANDKSKLIMKSSSQGGDVVLSPERRFTVQLKPGGFMRVAQGESSDDGPVLASRAATRDDELIAKINEMQAWMRALLIPVPGGTSAPVQAWTGADLLPVDPEDLASAVIRLPSRSVSAAGVVEGDDGTLPPDEDE